MIEYFKIGGIPNSQFNACGFSFIMLDGDQDSAYNFRMREHRYPGQRREVRRTRARIENNYLYVWVIRMSREFKFPIVERYETEEEYIQEIEKYSTMLELVS